MEGRQANDYEQGGWGDGSGERRVGVVNSDIIGLF